MATRRGDFLTGKPHEVLTVDSVWAHVDHALAKAAHYANIGTDPLMCLLQ